MDKLTAKQKLRSLIRVIPKLKELGEMSAEFQKWKRDVKLALTNIFGPRSEHVGEFESIPFYSSNVYATTSDHQRAYRQGLARALAILKSMVGEIDDYWPPSTPETKQTSSAPHTTIDQAKVFIVHGRDTELLDQLCTYLNSIGLSPVEWNQAIAKTQKGTPNIAEILDAAFSEAQAVIVLLTGDDEAKLRHEFLKDDDPPYEQKLTPQSRPNVLFESGMAMGRYPSRTVLVQIGGHRPFSDIAGKHITHLDNTAEKRQELATKLSNAGCKVVMSGTRWLKAGNLDQEAPHQYDKQQHNRFSAWTERGY
jgi:predicted nucleotide-binding protein